MCLDQPTKAKRIKFGYKVYEKREGKLMPMWRNRQHVVITGKWLNERALRDPKDSISETIKYWCTQPEKSSYTKGIHVYDHKRAAFAIASGGLNAEVRKIQVFMIVAHGMEGDFPVTVCKAIKVLEKVRR
jgi:hypothetical protein